MRVLVTGSAGFLGWHTCVRLRALTSHEIIAVHRANWADLGSLAKEADAIVHIAGVNRAPFGDVGALNVACARDVAAAAKASERRPRIVYANTIHAGNGSPYGTGKSEAGNLLADAAVAVDAPYVNILLPNLFGEHGRPGYNSFVATFVDAVTKGARPKVQDRLVPLLHAQRAAQALLDGLEGGTRVIRPFGHEVGVKAVYDLLSSFHELYSRGEFPSLAVEFEVDLFNTYRAAVFPRNCPIGLTAHADERGRLVETVRAHGGQGQTFVSTTRPGLTRGDHFHLSKVERFAVLSGHARISLRRVLTDEVVSFDVSGKEPVVVDMPTMWVHNITNTGEEDLTTMFWTHSLFDPEHPDTYSEKVQPA